MKPAGSILVYISIVILAGCVSVGRHTRSADDLARQVTTLADEYVRECSEAFPLFATISDIPSPRHDDRWGDNSLAALASWRAMEDRLLAQLNEINPDMLVDRPEWVTYGVLREQLETGTGTEESTFAGRGIAKRICREELWYTRSDMGLMFSLTYVTAAQPVDSPAAKDRALARWRDLARYLDVEIVNLKQGIEAGYVGEKNNVRRLIAQMDLLLNDPIEKTSLYDPARRAMDANFGRKLAEVIANDVRPAIRRYRDFLKTIYLPRAREQASAAATPGGAACYRAFLRGGTSLTLDPEEIHRIGLEQMERIEQEMRGIAERSFHTSDLPALFAHVTNDKSFFFAGGDEKLRLARESIRRAEDAIPRVFSLLPQTDIEVRPLSAVFGDYYQQSPESGRPAIFWTSLQDAENQPRVSFESMTFHEAIPGHHLQFAIGIERGSKLHPIARYFFSNAFGEGWALYGERIADELGLFSEDLYRLGMLSQQALRAARLVVDTGLHAKGWDRERAIEYMLAHTAQSHSFVESEVDRYIGYPGQALGYMIGMLEIQRLREEAQAKLGALFDLKQFHDRVLEDGNITLPMLRVKIERWITTMPLDKSRNLSNSP